MSKQVEQERSEQERSEQVKETIRKTILEILEQSTSQKNIRKLAEKHKEKIHFVPVRYRVIGGILQGLNIKFGNFIEQLLRNLIETDPKVQVMDDTGKKITLFFTPETDALIDRYITQRQLPDSPDDCSKEFSDLLDKIIEQENRATKTNKQRQGIKKDVDVLFQTEDGTMVYAELKYNDDHDTGKFIDINRKLIKTWAGLVVRHKVTSKDELLPILYYFNPTKRYGPIYLPSSHVLRGAQFFDKFFSIKYEEVDHYLSEIGEDPRTLEMFDQMYCDVRYKLEDILK